ncbi:adenosylcobinamide-phosphate synthase CbiB [Labilibacter marinus]|uniref:adenosylcobinamide-phosphate synthase CbiB n=1 Tax=Labilibacter marinus TaxID=1477105 RepID=UPI00094FDC4F|nr:adenosylcobinamide-phosphate synthase CbiB [Labilibacter marinus]
MLDVEYIPVYALVLGFVLDAIIGDPYSWPHPIKRFGCLIAYAENRWNKGSNKTLKGGLVSLVLISGTWVIYYGLQDLLLSVDKWFLLIASVILVFYGLANRTLINEGLKVINALEKEGIEAGRKQVGFIVGRDTSQLSPQQIYTAVLETLSENLSDGVIAPLFYYAIGGFPLMFTYKMINTLDSMIGYKSDKYKQFGMVAAKIDDVANYIPARLTALIMVVISLSYRGLAFIFKYGHKHASPNAGYPESALAGILNCRFGGPNVYHGKLVEKPFIGENNRDIVHADVIKTCWINAGSSIIMVALALLFLLL